MEAAGHEIDVEPVVVRTLSEYADFLPRASSGLANDLARRLSIITFRVALVHALVERADRVTAEHLERALALAEYSRRGIPWVFGNTIGNRDADLLLRHLQAAGVLRTRSIARGIIRDPIRRQDAIDELVRLGYARVVSVETGGRPRSELRLDLDGRSFVAFDRLWNKPPGKTHGESGQKIPSERETASQKPAKSLPEACQKPARSVTEVPAEPEKRAVDHSTGETQAAEEATWAKPCSDYLPHQTSHRNTPDGWACIVCHPLEEGLAEHVRAGGLT